MRRGVARKLRRRQAEACGPAGSAQRQAPGLDRRAEDRRVGGPAVPHQGDAARRRPPLAHRPRWRYRAGHGRGERRTTPPSTPGVSHAAPILSRPTRACTSGAGNRAGRLSESHNPGPLHSVRPSHSTRSRLAIASDSAGADAPAASREIADRRNVPESRLSGNGHRARIREIFRRR